VGIRDRGPKLTGTPIAREFQVRARDRSRAIVLARDLAWREGLWVQGDARVWHAPGGDGRDFIVRLACLRQD
jgi:hypothetical protein